jgi:bacteriorhodopsin
MMEIAAFFARLVGHMLDPLIPIIVWTVIFVLEKWSIWLRFVIALAAMLVVGLAIQLVNQNGFPAADKTERMVFALLATAAWFGIIAGFRRWRRRGSGLNSG